MSAGPKQREPLSERELGWLAIEIALALAAWVVATSLLFDNTPHIRGGWPTP